MKDFSTLVQESFRAKKEQFNAEIELHSAIAKEDIYEPFLAMIDKKEEYKDQEYPKEVMVQASGKDILVLVFSKFGQTIQLKFGPDEDLTGLDIRNI
mmetsp:Transcript_15753/g.15216  ORF Transcript_15753/g.15216 Transcript_15753/m.15216 type:complete len:97 (+) Transcript_15753:2-292(+)|eukprot:CAMPEP_0170567094 /NCGR_PEP_ID=MMETSP0211-20121228/80264_1 /TAXON_ID=311385 /ORGANISM="Pseudokeronopsis sp., Strain OXSARD2" /LENGTH=96 /DNA_ID=CAMNT_0010888461 /DNA_START=333 /DNA_END=623 /DNA_ORIENTATION=-